MSCLFGHQWNSCKCVRCGKIRSYYDDSYLKNAHHYDLATCKCTVCGMKADSSWDGHDWEIANVDERNDTDDYAWMGGYFASYTTTTTTTDYQCKKCGATKGKVTCS